MYKLLVVDDEPIIVDGLYELFKDLKSYPLDVYKACSGAEALEWLSKKRIDVVVTDIRMPGIDGLQLMDRIHRSWPDCKVVFLTGHDEFDYVYKAIRHEGVKYLLKTEGYESIVETVERFLEQIGQGMKRDELLRQAKEQLLKAGPVLQKEFLLETIEGGIEAVRQQQLDDLQIPLRAEEEILLFAGIVCETKDKSIAAGKTDIFTVHYFVEQQMAAVASIAGITYRNMMIWFMQKNPNPESRQSLTEEQFIFQCRGMLENVQSMCRETLLLPVSFAIAGKAVKWHEIADGFPTLKTLLNYCSLSGIEAVLVEGSASEDEAGFRVNRNRMPQTINLQLKKLESMEIYMEQGRKEEFLRSFREIRQTMSDRPSNPSSAAASVAYELFYSLSLMLISYMNRSGNPESVIDKIDYDRLTRYDAFKSLDEALEYLEAVALRLFEMQDIEQEKRSAAAMQRLQTYIQNHPEGDLSLSSLADLVYFNPKYLSRLFKQETGMNLSDYISEVKLNHAKELLKLNKMKVHEIAERVGFYSAPYFTRFFKKGTNMSPQEYRDANKSAILPGPGG